MIHVRIFHTLCNIWDIDQPELKWIELFLLGCWIFSRIMFCFSSASCLWGLSFDTTRKIQGCGWNAWNHVIEMIYCEWHRLTWSYLLWVVAYKQWMWQCSTTAVIKLDQRNIQTTRNFDIALSFWFANKGYSLQKSFKTLQAQYNLHIQRGVPCFLLRIKTGALNTGHARGTTFLPSSPGSFACIWNISDPNIISVLTSKYQSHVSGILAH